MNQEKIGKFIMESRKNKNMTQSTLAEKLGVSDRTIGNWENGRNMPDLSLFKPLCDELDISINELISGEKIEKDVYQERFEENIISTIDYSTKRININNNFVGVILILVGFLVTFAAMTIFPSDSSWGSIYGVLGGIISLVGISRLTKKLSHIKRLVIHFGYFILFVLLLFVIDYISVISLEQVPRFCTVKTTGENIYLCENPFYNVYKINRDTKNEYIVVDTKKEYTVDTVPVVPFNRSESVIDNIIKYKNKYIGNNSNIGNLIGSLPLSEYGYVFEIKDDLGLIINYHITDWYINENYYLEKSIVYNSISIFALIDNVKYIEFNFSGKSYKVSRDNVVNNFSNFDDIVKDNISKEAFNKYLEGNINDNSFIEAFFNKIIS